ncbi:MAG: hypothetical protein BECKG1743D_GA0114223_100259 [Candidatus Kentron sp. G]|nr:MAG: hypothetical protein BECKG1743F_GA0114225_101375 [Candidatus Kentron sp. G]VFM97706.1 MAG: hypothetical protein BECKG1743D_GA0114223_100259 [Candidatus Kentron sp. G]VFM98805.1 MAG: hypothetical protein BECKG1743E_GA0114224_102096 [Candidatus Kentron sp. G]
MNEHFEEVFNAVGECEATFAYSSIGFPFSARADGEERTLFGAGRIKIPEIFPKKCCDNHFAPHKAEQIGRREKRGCPSISGSGLFNQDSMKWGHIRTLTDGGKCQKSDCVP